MAEPLAPAPTNADALLQRLEDDGIERLWVTYHDYNGRAQAKTVPREGFPSTVRQGLVFALANLNFATDDHQAAAATLLADDGDFLAVPDPRSYVRLPRFPGTARCHAWMRTPEGPAWDGCPRTRLESQIDELAQMGYSLQAALEPEFFLLTRDDAGEYQPADTTRMFTQAGLATQDAFITRLFAELRQTGIPPSQLGKEYGVGQYELSVDHQDPLGAVDDYLSVKETVRDIARQMGYLVTFMPKPHADWAGNSLHVHLSLWDAAGARDLTPSDADETSLSEPGRWFLGGIMAHLDALTGLGSPTVNSYKRLQPGSWAPANTYWGYGNRSGVVRIPGTGKRRHLEFRSPDNSCQPFLLLAGLIGAGIDGLRNRIEPPPPFQGDISRLSPEEIVHRRIGYLPRTLPVALAALEADQVVAAAVGVEALKHLLTVKRQELATYETLVHPWERETYLEVI